MAGRPSPLLDDAKLHELIETRAYELYETRGCTTGHDCEDWLEAERQILAELETPRLVAPSGVATFHAA